MRDGLGAWPSLDGVHHPWALGMEGEGVRSSCETSFSDEWLGTWRPNRLNAQAGLCVTVDEGRRWHATDMEAQQWRWTRLGWLTETMLGDPYGPLDSHQPQSRCGVFVSEDGLARDYTRPLSVQRSDRATGSQAPALVSYSTARGTLVRTPKLAALHPGEDAVKHGTDFGRVGRRDRPGCPAQSGARRAGADGGHRPRGGISHRSDDTAQMADEAGPGVPQYR